jgi:xanthine dehydrogenase YagS FAD-binding subunit
MQAFEHAAPGDLKQALGLLSSEWGETDILAGGTDLLSLMKERIHTPKRVVSLSSIKALGGIESSADGLRIGATATLDDLLASSEVRSNYSALVHAAEGVSSPQIRAMGTVGGDLLQRPRCWYFRNGLGLLAKDSKGNSLVPDGENRYHAILGNKGPAYFVNASSLAPALVALGATATLASADGERELAIESLYLTPENDGDRELAIKPNEILTQITVPSASGSNATYEVRERQLLDWPLAAAAVSLKMSGDKVESARVVLGHVAPTPWRSAEAEQALAGGAINEDTAMKAGAAAVSGAMPLSQNKHKVQLARVAVKRAVLRAAGMSV